MAGWGSGAGALDEFENIVFDFEPFMEEILPQLNCPGHHQSAEARKAAIEAAAVSAPPGMSAQKLDEKCVARLTFRVSLWGEARAPQVPDDRVSALAPRSVHEGRVMRVSSPIRHGQNACLPLG